MSRYVCAHTFGHSHPYLPEPSRHAFMLRPDEAIGRYGTYKATRRQGLSYVVAPFLELVRREQMDLTSALANGDICDVERCRPVLPSGSDAFKQMAILALRRALPYNDLNVAQRSSRVTLVALIVFGGQHAHAFVVLFAFELAPLLGRHTLPAQSL